MGPAVFAFAHPDDETLAAGVAVVEHLAAGQDVHLVCMTLGGGSQVRQVLNGATANPSAYWGVHHDPADEGYPPLDVPGFETARVAEWQRAGALMRSGLTGSLTLTLMALPDGGVTQVAAREALLEFCAALPLVGEGDQIRLKTHTPVPELDAHPDHRAIGRAVEEIHASNPALFAAPRYYVLPGTWGSPALDLVDWHWDTPASTATAARARNAARSYGSWPFAIGHHSRPDWFALLVSDPKCLFHT